MSRDLMDDLDDLLSAVEQIEALGLDCHAVHDMLGRLQLEIRSVRREMLLSDAATLIQASRTYGGIE